VAPGSRLETGPVVRAEFRLTLIGPSLLRRPSQAETTRTLTAAALEFRAAFGPVSR